MIRSSGSGGGGVTPAVTGWWRPTGPGTLPAAAHPSGFFGREVAGAEPEAPPIGRVRSERCTERSPADDTVSEEAYHCRQ